jgi:hypothetical protein
MLSRVDLARASWARLLFDEQKTPVLADRGRPPLICPGEQCRERKRGWGGAPGLAPAHRSCS